MEAKKFNLERLLEDIKSGGIQLPDFQRSWIWSDRQIKSLLESVVRNFPINSIMLLECDTNQIIFSCRTIEGVGQVEHKPRYLVLDGQQRLTSLFGALFSDKAVEFSNDKKRFYYINMTEAIKAVENADNLNDVIFSVPEDKKSKALDLSTPEKEFANDMFPLNQIFDSRKWLRGYENFHNHDAVATDFADEFDKKIIGRFSQYEIAYIELEKNISLEAVCRIFEKVNTGGTELKVFDLSTAILASHKENGKPINLRADWKNISENFAERNLKILSALEGADFITALTLLVSYRHFCENSKNPVSCKRENILKLSHTDYLEYRKALADGFVEAGKFLAGEAVTEKKYLPYKPQLIPLAALLAELKLSGKDNLTSRNKLRQWYWCGVFGEAYRDGHLSRFIKDIMQVMNWIDTDETPEIIQNTQISAPKLIKYKNVQSAAYKGMIAIIFRNGATDFLSGRIMSLSANFDESIDDHHIFPKAYCAGQNFSKDKYDSIANKTPILSETNRIIGNKAPSVYIRDFERRGIKSHLINNALRSHFADPALCRANNFDEFIVDRAQKIFDAIETLTGREISDREKIFGVPLT